MLGSRMGACGVVAAIALIAAAPAAASSPFPREAAVLAGLIRKDARTGGTAKLVRIHDCCGIRIIDVYYRARPRPKAPAPPSEPLGPPPVEAPTEGAYHLRLIETDHGRPVSVSVREFGTEPGYVLGTEPQTHASGLGYDITIEWVRSLPKYSPHAGMPGWTATVFYGYLTAASEQAGILSTAQLRQATEVADKAARHAPVEGETDLAN
jgi:hypothetical protein